VVTQGTLWFWFSPDDGTLIWSQDNGLCGVTGCEYGNWSVNHATVTYPAGVPTIGVTTAVQPIGRFYEINAAPFPNQVILSGNASGVSACFLHLYLYDYVANTIIRQYTTLPNTWNEHAECWDDACSAIAFSTTEGTTYLGPNGSGGCLTPALVPFVMNTTGGGHFQLIDRGAWISAGLIRVGRNTIAFILKAGVPGNGTTSITKYGAPTMRQGRTRLTGRTRTQ